MHICLEKNLARSDALEVIIQPISEKCCWHPPGPGHTYFSRRHWGQQELERLPGKKGIFELGGTQATLREEWGSEGGDPSSTPLQPWSLPTCSASSLAISLRHLPPGRLHYLQILNRAMKTAPHLHTHPCLKQPLPPRHLHFILHISVWRSHLEVPLLCASGRELSQSTHHSVVIVDFSVFS